MYVARFRLWRKRTWLTRLVPKYGNGVLNWVSLKKELAARAGLHRNYHGMIERVERNPTLTAIERLAKGLKTRPSELIAAAEANATAQK